MELLTHLHDYPLKEIMESVSLGKDIDEYNLQFIRETFEKIPLYKENIKIDDKHSVKEIISMMKSNLQSWYKSAVQKYSNLSDEINDTYVKINDLLDHDKMARFKHRNDIVSGDFPGLYLKDKKNGKIYYFTYDQLYLPIDDITNWVDEIMYNKPIDYDEFSKLYGAVDKWYQENHSFIDHTTPFVKLQHLNKVKLEAAIKYSGKYIKSLYTVLHNINVVVSNELMYLSATQKAYDGLINKYKNDKKACDNIDKIFKYCLAFTNRSIEWNMSNFDVSLKMYNEYAEQIEKYYEIIKS